MNKITKIFNNIGFYCSINDNIFIPNNIIKSYQGLSNDSVGYFIPYLVRNLKDNLKWEIGVGEVVWVDGTIGVKRNELSSSSNNDNNVNFIGNENEFYLFVNNINFNSSFNNVILKNDHFTIDNVTSIYIVDNSEKTIDCILPQANDARNVVVDVKALSSKHNVKIRLFGGEILGSTSDAIRLVSDGQSWYILNSFDSTVNFGNLSNNDTFNSLSSPNGDDYSFQYKDGNSLEGSNLYWDSGNSNKLLLGADNENDAHTIIPTSGSQPTIFNKDLQASDFIVYGSGQPYRNLFFSYDGRIGVNIPSGSRPQTIFHVVNYSCNEILRLENRTTCQPAKLTIYHRPSSLANGGVCSILNLAGRDSVGNIKEYATVSSVAEDTVAGNGGLVLSVSSGGSALPIVSGNSNNVFIGYDNSKRLNINNNGTVSLSGSNTAIRGSDFASINTNNAGINISNNNISLSHSSLNLGNGTVTVSGPANFNNTVNANNIVMSSIAPSSLLTIDNANRIAPISGISINSNNSIVLNNIEPNRLLSVDNNKNIVGIYSLDDYFLTERDIVWEKFEPRIASVCLKQVVFLSPVPAEEFSIGDQIEINTGSVLIYRIIENIIFNNNTISELLLDQNVTTNSVDNITVVSITKGGYLLIEKSVTGTTSDSTSNILSIRPQTPTVFNSAQKNIDFVIYGTDIQPAFKVHANAGSVARASGVYYSFATRENSIDPILINSGGSGLNNNFSTANFNYNPNTNLFAAKLSSVGSNGRNSYYGTYDQNGNVREWLESDTTEGVISQSYAAGGSYNTVDPLSLKSIDSLAISGKYEDVGFRIASITNINDNFNTNLNLSFVNVLNPNNIADPGVPGVGNIRIDGSDSIEENLGVVNKNYRIGIFEITNSQYVTFLNSVATVLNNPVTNNLYNVNMSGTLGGIVASGNDTTVEYSIKNNMGNKPVNFVSYINSLQFINWIENGAPSGIDQSEADEIINEGAYQILLAGNNYYISANKNRKYFLPSLNQYHKAAYFEYKDSVVISGSPVITINTESPHIVATEKVNNLTSLSINNTQDSKQILANLTVSGWLVVDSIIVRDGTIRSRLPDGYEDQEDENEDFGPQSTDPTVPPSRGSPNSSTGSKFWSPSNGAIPRPDGSFGEREPPLPPDGDGTEEASSCQDPDLIENNNVPFWCSEEGRLKGPFFY
jgi:hypothetical protein